jgi:hypothetical protein
MAGGVVETDPEKLAQYCECFMEGTKKQFDGPGPNDGDMWFFELYHHLHDCANALRRHALDLRAQEMSNEIANAKSH